ncbi:MAG: methyltransferase domain-containing protein [Neomegalonema sp.]|nr:methyltransferase domain-containing protein [Neomegalonema sp.]
MHLDVVDLRNFYYGTALGARVQRRLQRSIGEIWPSVRGASVGGFGFAAPFLRPLRREAERVIVLMPAAQGVLPWPREGPNCATLVHPTDWPLQTGALDCLMLAHGLENVDDPGRLLDECWRALAPEGRLLVLAPNRSGMWARRDATPFGYGRPYSFGQLDQHLTQHGFEIATHAAALYFPPSERRFWLRSGALAEQIGRRLDVQRLAGVLLVEAIKRVPAPTRGRRQTVADPLDVLGEIIRPSPVPAPNFARSGRDMLPLI